MPIIHTLYQRSIPINDAIHIVVPTVGEVLEHEEAYYNMVYLLTAMPIDLMVQLDDIGIDFTTINEYELFLLLFAGIQNEDVRLIFGDLDLTRFKPIVNKTNGMIVLIDEKTGVVIDRAIHARIADTLRRLHNLEKNRRRPGNAEARSYMLERARIKQKRRAAKRTNSQLEQLIVAMVNTEQYKYDYESSLGLSIVQFNESVRQIIRKVDYDNRMHGIFSGTLNAKELRPDELNWISQS